MKRRHMLLSTLILILFMSSCHSNECTYSFRQDLRNVEKIEICKHDIAESSTMPLVELSDSEKQAILSDLSSMTCFEYSIGDHPRNYGELVILIHYLDGEIEVIGLTNTGWISHEGKWNLSGISFDWEEIKNLLEQYVEKDIISEIYG